MILVLVQHGEAKREEEDPARPLTDRGVRETGVTADGLRALGVRPSLVVHSGKLRARQTAEILAEKLGAEVVREVGWLAPLDDPVRARGELLKLEEDEVLVVGHLPHLSRLASLLLVKDPAREVVRFRYSSALGLESQDRESWRIIFFLPPSPP